MARGLLQDTCHTSLHQMLHILMQEQLMRTTVTLDTDLVERAEVLSGLHKRGELLREALNALIERESARRLALLGGSEPVLEAAPRRRPAA